MGNPQTLVITKTDMSWAPNMQKWGQRSLLAKAALLGFNQHDLREISGLRLYPLVKEGNGDINLALFRVETGEYIGPGDEGASSNVLSPVARNGTPTPSASARLVKQGNTPAQVIGVKRPAPDAENLIDLTGDSE